ncbi:hypothetical protein AnigIFM63309_001515 [Aspergillus niger]|nr:hypothetical protein AnigIFM63309_001515 [Aspergillus niger]
MPLFITDNYDEYVRFVNQVENGSQLDEGQLGDELPPPPTYEEAIRCPAPQALSTRHLSPDPVQDSPPRYQNGSGQSPSCEQLESPLTPEIADQNERNDSDDEGEVTREDKDDEGKQRRR